MIAERQTDLYFQLLKQTFKEELSQLLGNGVYSALPNDIGRATERFIQLCKDHGLCPKCGMTIKDCDCEADDGYHR